MQIFKTLMVTVFFLTPLIAEEIDAASKCEETYNGCLLKCDAAEDGSETCYSDCDAAYEKCLTLAQDNNNS
ncbi:MAG: hypothetical protein WBF77_02880 [Sulfurimonadaceae bacterium]